MCILWIIRSELIGNKDYHVDSGHYKHSVRTLEATELYYAIVDCIKYGPISSIDLPCDVSIFVYW